LSHHYRGAGAETLQSGQEWTDECYGTGSLYHHLPISRICVLEGNAISSHDRAVVRVAPFSKESFPVEQMMTLCDFSFCFSVNNTHYSLVNDHIALIVWFYAASTNQVHIWSRLLCRKWPDPRHCTELTDNPDICVSPATGILTQSSGCYDPKHRQTQKLEQDPDQLSVTQYPVPESKSKPR
jgi:hypothetical protein